MQKYGLMANAEESASKATPCLVCDDPQPGFQWTDYSGEGVCLRCGTPYQLKWGTLAEGESYPRCNLSENAIPMFRRYFAETGQQNGHGCIIGGDEYPEIVNGREQFNAWWKIHKDEYPELTSKTADGG